MADVDTQLRPHVAVIGGGCAGLSAAVALARAGIRTTVFESSHQLSGRARGVQWQGMTLDNGQHILLGAYVRTLELLQLCNINPDKAMLRLPLKLEMANTFSLSCPSFLPAPLHILAGLLQAKGLSMAERMGAIRLMVSLKINQFQLASDIPLQQFLSGQPPRVVTMLWEPLCLAALNTPLATASTQAFLNILRDSFARHKSDSDLLLPRMDLSTLFADPAANYIKTHGGEVHLNCKVEKINFNNSSLEISFKKETHDFSHVIIATSPFRTAPLLQSLPDMEKVISQCTGLQYQPIYTIYLQYAAEIRLPESMCGITGRLGQWVFDRGQLYGQKGLIAVVISVEGKHQTLSQAELALAIHHELQAIFPHILSSPPEWHKVIAEKRATFACVAGLDRPGQYTPHKNVVLAGDYVSTGDRLQDYPATIEGAVRSGFQAAEIILNNIN